MMICFFLSLVSGMVGSVVQDMRLKYLENFKDGSDFPESPSKIGIREVADWR